MTIDLGRVAYYAYVKHCGGLSVHGEQLPVWNDQAPEIRAHWQAAAQAVAEQVRVSDAHTD